MPELLPTTARTSACLPFHTHISLIQTIDRAIIGTNRQKERKAERDSVQPSFNLLVIQIETTCFYRGPSI